MQVELAPDEGGAGDTPETVRAPALAGFGLPSPDELAALAMRYQIAQKLHASTDPHDLPTWVNDRPRDIVDLVLLRELVTTEKSPTTPEIARATKAVFDARAADATSLGRTPRFWPATVVAHRHWPADYAKTAADGGVTLSFEDAVDVVNDWIAEIAAASAN